MAQNTSQAGTTWDYRYDSENHLLSAKKNNVEVASFAYDALGRRLVKTVNNMSRRYHYDGMSDRVLYETDDTGAVVVWYNWVGGQLVSQRRADGSVFYYVYNAHGDVVALYNSDGTLNQSYSYDTWGTPTLTVAPTKTAVENDYQYGGYRWNPETGLYFAASQYYDPNWGRFISQDTAVTVPSYAATQTKGEAIRKVVAATAPAKKQVTAPQQQLQSRPQPQPQPQPQTNSAVEVLRSRLMALPAKTIGGKTYRVAMWAQQIHDASEKYGVPPDVIAAVMQQESGGDPLANNSFSHGRGEACCDGGKGLMQVDLGAADPCGPPPYDMTCGHWKGIPGATREDKADYLYDPSKNVNWAVGNVLGPAWDATGGDIEAALLRYNGGGDRDYVRHVMYWHNLLQ